MALSPVRSASISQLGGSFSVPGREEEDFSASGAPKCLVSDSLPNAGARCPLLGENYSVAIDNDKGRGVPGIDVDAYSAAIQAPTQASGRRVSSNSLSVNILPPRDGGAPPECKCASEEDTPVRNSTMPFAHTVKYVGVRSRGQNRWVAEIKDNNHNVRKWLGTFGCPVEAAQIFDAAARAIRGPRAKCNFPEGHPKYLSCAAEMPPHMLTEPLRSLLLASPLPSPSKPPGTQSDPFRSGTTKGVQQSVSPAAEPACGASWVPGSSAVKRAACPPLPRRESRSSSNSGSSSGSSSSNVDPTNSRWQLLSTPSRISIPAAGARSRTSPAPLVTDHGPVARHPLERPASFSGFSSNPEVSPSLGRPASFSGRRLPSEAISPETTFQNLPAGNRLANLGCPTRCAPQLGQDHGLALEPHTRASLSFLSNSRVQPRHLFGAPPANHGSDAAAWASQSQGIVGENATHVPAQPLAARCPLAAEGLDSPRYPGYVTAPGGIGEWGGGSVAPTFGFGTTENSGVEECMAGGGERLLVFHSLWQPVKDGNSSAVETRSARIRLRSGKQEEDAGTAPHAKQQKLGDMGAMSGGWAPHGPKMRGGSSAALVDVRLACTLIGEFKGSNGFQEGFLELRRDVEATVSALAVKGADKELALGKCTGAHEDTSYSTHRNSPTASFGEERGTKSEQDDCARGHGGLSGWLGSAPVEQAGLQESPWEQPSASNYLQMYGTSGSCGVEEVRSALPDRSLEETPEHEPSQLRQRVASLRLMSGQMKPEEEMEGEASGAAPVAARGLGDAARHYKLACPSENVPAPVPCSGVLWLHL